MSKQIESWQDFFNMYDGDTIRIECKEGDLYLDESLERLYQAIKARLIDELSPVLLRRYGAAD